MKVIDLRCANGHSFEGWFASEDDFLSQNGRGLVECPLCTDRVITRMPSAPRLNLSGAREPTVPAQGPAQAPKVPPAAADLQAMWMQMVRHAIPGFTNNWLVMIKATALLSIIGLDDMVHRANLASAATRQPFTFYATIAGIYLAVTTVSILGLGWLERRFSLGVRKVEF